VTLVGIELAALHSTALICVHDFTGKLWAFRELVQLMQRPVLGLRCDDQTVRKSRTTRSLALTHVSEVRETIPSKAYVRLVAYSAGCQIAFRATLTCEASNSIVQLTLLDGRLPSLRDGSALSTSAAWDDVLRAVSLLQSHAYGALLSVAADRLALVRIATMLGQEGCDVARALLCMADEATAIDVSVGDAVYVKTVLGVESFPPISETRCVLGGHFDFMIRHAEGIALVEQCFWGGRMRPSAS
jgi:thioesterase domain-containing protein